MTKIDSTLAKTLLEKLWEVRLFEENTSRLYKEGVLPGFVHLSLGQEACAVGACQTLQESDFITSTHRGHGHCIAKGADLNRMMSELYGKETGYSKGRGGSMHIADVNAGILGANGIVGQSTTLAIGAALSFQTKKLDNVVLAFFGEGASGSGAVHEAMNIAGIWKLPVIFFCESNKYAELSPFDVHVPIKNISDRSKGYGFKGITIDGNNLVDVYSNVLEAVKLARNGNGPTLIEAKTNRWHGHYEGDPQKYKPSSELDEKNWDDPIIKFQDFIKKEKIISETEIDKIKEIVDKKIIEAIKFAEQSKNPSAEILLEDVYASDF